MTPGTVKDKISKEDWVCTFQMICFTGTNVIEQKPEKLAFVCKSNEHNSGMENFGLPLIVSGLIYIFEMLSLKRRKVFEQKITVVGHMYSMHVCTDIGKT